MDNFEEKFLEELAKARARLEGKEAYDDEAIKNEFDPDLKPEKNEATAPEKKVKPADAKVSVEKTTADVIKKSEPEVTVTETPVKKKGVNSEKLAVIWGGITVALSLVITAVSQFISIDSDAWLAFKSYMPFIGIVFGASAVICGASFIKNNKKGVWPLVLGIVAILISAVLPSL